MSAPTTRPRPAAPRFLVAILLAAGLFAALVGATWAGAFGRDLHILRVAVTAGVLFLAALLLVWPSRTREMRVVALAAAFVFGGFAWWSVPNRIGGMNLYAAATKRDAIQLQLGPVRFEDVPTAGQWRNSIDELAREYPTLADQLRPEFAAWGADAVAAVADQLRDTPADDVAAARSAYARGIELCRVFPEHRPRIVGAFQQWTRQAMLAYVDSLNALPLARWDDFSRAAAPRRRHAQSFPESRDELIAAENRWVKKSAGIATESALWDLESKPGEARAVCHQVELRVRSLPSLAAAAERFLETRAALFRVAHDAATREVFAHLRDKHYDRAFDVALQHGFGWALTAKSLGPEEVKLLAELREHSRHLAIRFEKAGLVDFAPAPRGRETAPPPRTRSSASGTNDLVAFSFISSPAQPPDVTEEQKYLEEALTHIIDKKYLFAVARLASLQKSKTLPKPVAKILPGLINDLRALDAVTRLAESPTKGDFPDINTVLLPAVVMRQFAWLSLLRAVSNVLETKIPAGAHLPWGVEAGAKLLATIAADFDADSVSRLRVELSARLFLLGRPQDATKLLEGETPNEYARQVLEDLRLIVVGSGTLTSPQVARFMPEKGLVEIPGARALVPVAHRSNWQPPKSPAETETTLVKLEKRTRVEVARTAAAEIERVAKKVNEAVEAIRAAKP
jgi:hypothetical protein